MEKRPPTRADTVLLPSGRTVQVTYIEEPPSGAPLAALEVCSACGANRVHPVAWEEEGHDDWRITLRCPDCLHEATGLYDEASVRRYDRLLDREAAEATAALARVARANMRDYAQRFASALHANALLPEDF